MAPKAKRGGKGRKKVVIKRMDKEEARQVTFCKRRRGLFNKASELAILTGAQVAAIAFSPGAKAFSFGHSSVDAVVKRFLAGGSAEAQDPAYDNKLQNLCRKLNGLRTELADYKIRKERMDEAMANARAAGDRIAAWVEVDVRDIADMGVEDMAAFAAGLLQLQAAVSQRANKVLIEAYNVGISRNMQVTPPAPPQLFVGSTFEFGSSSSSSSANAGLEMPPTPAFPCMQMMLPMSSPQMLMDMQKMLLANPPPLLLEMPQQPMYTTTGTEMQHMARETSQPPQFLDEAYGGDGVQQGLGPNFGFPY